MEPLPHDLHRPPIHPATAEVVELTPETPFAHAFRQLSQGAALCLTGSYGSAMAFYSWMKKRIGARHPIHDYASSRRHRDAWYACSARALIRISHHEPTLAKAPRNPWLRAFFPDLPEFFISFADFLGLNGAWQWYRKGVRYPVLPHPIHPFYGTYFPTRHDHLLLFDRWLEDTGTGHHERAMDMGTGSGVLAFIMHARGVPHIHATDINPNAIYSVRQDLKRLGSKAEEGIIPEEGDLLGGFQPGPRDLVVFNPPWIPGEPEKPMDEACYYRPGFFEVFFRRMARQCPSGTTLALLFSDFAVAAGLLEEHPVLDALESQGAAFTLTDHLREPVRQAPARVNAWLSEVRRREQVELLVLHRI